MGQFKTSLKPDDLKLFYGVLYQYENEGKSNHKGYSYKKVPLEIKNKVSLIHDTGKNKIELSFPETPNTLCYKGKEVCGPCLSICAIALLMLVLSMRVTIMS